MIRYEDYKDTWLSFIGEEKHQEVERLCERTRTDIIRSDHGWTKEQAAERALLCCAWCKADGDVAAAVAAMVSDSLGSILLQREQLRHPTGIQLPEQSITVHKAGS